MIIIPQGDGTYLVMAEGEAFVSPEPTPAPKKPQKYTPPILPPRKLKKIKRRPDFAGSKNPFKVHHDSLVGYRDWWSYKKSIIGRYARAGAPSGSHGVGLARMGYVFGHVKRKVKSDMEKIDKKFPDVDPLAREALEGALYVLRSPNSQALKLQAAKLLLEFTKAKPAAKSDVTVKKAEDWLMTLGDDDESAASS